MCLSEGICNIAITGIAVQFVAVKINQAMQLQWCWLHCLGTAFRKQRSARIVHGPQQQGGIHEVCALGTCLRHSSAAAAAPAHPPAAPPAAM